MRWSSGGKAARASHCFESGKTGGMPPAWDASTYGERFAPVYDEWYGNRYDTDAAVATLARLAERGPVLELGIGTGRLAIPLADLGLEVDGVDASPAMVERLRAKPGAARIDVTVADMSDVPAPPGRYALTFVAANTLFNLDTADAQGRCVATVARALRPGGRFVVEAWVPDPARLAGDDADVVRVRSVEAARVVLEGARVDVGAQRLDTVVIELTEAGGVRLFPTRLRYAAPDELDGLAKAAGLELEWRWATWAGAPFTTDSDAHVSVWRRPA